MQVPILFDGFANKISQELPISRISRMAVGTATQEEPPLVTVSGPGVPKPTGPTQWVIESITWGTNVIWDFSYLGVMSRLRQDATINLLQYVAGDRVAFKNLKVGTGIQAAPKSTKAAPHGWQQTVTARQGDTLKKIAARVYKPANPGDWKIIAKANNIRDGNHLKKGQKIRIPKK
jgi:LysM repeat protein